MNIVQEKLRKIKEKSGLTQAELSRELGVSFPAFNAWWNGKTLPRKSAAEKIDMLFITYTADRPLPKKEFYEVIKEIEKESRRFQNVITVMRERKDILDNFIVKLTYHSDAIEGSTLTLKETAAILLDGAEIKDKAVIEQMEARNHKAAFLFLVAHVEEGGSIGEEFIKKLHLMLMNGVIETAGAYRFHGVRIAGTSVITANYMKVPALMAEFVKKISKGEKQNSLHVIISEAARMHADFEKIHPFADGNGRVGRLLLHAMLLKKNLPPAFIELNVKHLYYTYLEAAQEKGDYSFIEAFVGEAIKKGLKEIIE